MFTTVSGASAGCRCRLSSVLPQSLKRRERPSRERQERQERRERQLAALHEWFSADPE